jgi:rod shape determining protein RodA
MPRPGLEHLKKETFFSAMDYWLLVPILIISMIGLFVLNQVLSDGFGDLYPMNIYKQAGAVLVGLLIALLLCMVEVPTLRLIGWGLYGAGILLLVYVLVDGYSLAEKWGADSWLNLPLIGSFQPSELMKIGLAMVSALIFESIENRTMPRWKSVLILMAIYAAPLGLIMLQPDFGTTLVIVFMFLCMLFAAGLRWRYVLLGGSGMVAAALMAWFFYFADYQKNRIITFLYPGSDPDASYNLIQSKLAIASGGLTGSSGGPVHVPVKEADFIYTAVSEHMGFIGTTALLILIFFFLARCFYVASKMKTSRLASSLMVVGLAAGMAFHFVENLGMCVGLLPITGIPLPFVSLGGTAMIVNFLALGVILSISMDRKMQHI